MIREAFVEKIFPIIGRAITGAIIHIAMLLILTSMLVVFVISL